MPCVELQQVPCAVPLKVILLQILRTQYQGQILACVREVSAAALCGENVVSPHQDTSQRN